MSTNRGENEKGPRYNGSMSSTRFFAEKGIRELPEYGEIAQRHPSLEWIDDYQTFHRETLRREKDCVIFARKRGNWLKPFHCYQNGRYTYFSLDLAEGCLFDCAYCYLQSYLKHGALVLFVDCGGVKAEMERRTESNLWISTGLLSDSLLAERYFPAVSRISGMIPPGSVLELRSKSDDVAILTDDRIDRGTAVLSWSLNPQRIARDYEYRAASLERRLEAARRAVQLGFRIGFHFDPVFHFEGWQQEYSTLFDSLREFSTDRVAFLSLGLFRYMPELGSVIRKRFPSHRLMTGELIVDADGKYQYFRPIRREMYRVFAELFQPWKEAAVPILYSMEPDPRLTSQ